MDGQGYSSSHSHGDVKEPDRRRRGLPSSVCVVSDSRATVRRFIRILYIQRVIIIATMGLPIALGSKSFSCRSIATYHDHHAEDDDPSRPSQPLPLEDGSSELPPPLVAWAITQEGGDVASNHHSSYEWEALVTLIFYKLTRAVSKNDKLNGYYDDETETMVVAEFRIQIAPAAQSFSNQHNREMVYRVSLPIRSSSLYSPDPTTCNPLIAHFSDDRRSLICIFPLPRRQSNDKSTKPEGRRQTMAAFFPLRRAASVSPARPRRPPPLPSYLAGTNRSAGTTEDMRTTMGTVPLATEPRIILEDSDNAAIPRKPVETLSCLCNINFAGGTMSFVLVGDVDGNIRAIDPNPLSLSRPIPILLSSFDDGGSDDGGDDDKTLRGIRNMQTVTEGCVSGCYQGHLAVVDGQGSVALRDWQLTRSPSDETGGGVVSEIPLILGSSESLWFFSIKPTFWSLPSEERVDRMRWVTPWNLACLSTSSTGASRHQQQHQSCVVVAVWGWAAKEEGGHPVRRSTLKLREEELVETASSTFFMPDARASCDHSRIQIQSLVEHDPLTGCLLVSSSFDVENKCHDAAAAAEVVGLERGDRTNAKLPFVTVWNWRLNVRGFTLCHSPKHSLCRSTKHSDALSHLYIASDVRGRRRLVHILASPNAHSCSIQKDIYETGTLSPLSHQRHFRYCKPIVPESPLLLTHESICYPSASKLTATGDYQVEWKDVLIPTDHSYYHHNSYNRSGGNAPRLACIGKRGLSIAVAGQNYGLFVLEESSSTTRAAARKRTRWHRFSNDHSERSFRVIAMASWEGQREARTREDFMSEDLIVAVIAVSEGDGSKHDATAHYLSCWSPTRLDLQHQLLIQVSREQASHDSQWGLRLANGLFSVSIDILEEPSEQMASPNYFRKAIILLSNDSYEKDFMVFQIQLVRRSQSAAHSYSENQPCVALARCVGEYNLGSPADLFLAGGSFAFDLLASRRGKQRVDFFDYIATIGVIHRASAGFDAIAVSSSDIIAVGSVPLPRSAEIATYWLSDVAESLSTFVWTLQLSDSSLICWSVPFADNLTSHTFLVQSKDGASDATTSHFFGPQTLVHGNSPLLGSHSAAGSTEAWMQISCAATRQEFPLGPLPGSAFGVVLVSGQECRKLHRQLGQDFEIDHFSADFLGYEVFGPSDFILFPPVIVTALYMFMKNSNDASALLIQQHLIWRLESYPFRDSAMIALRLLALRSVEIYASSESEGDHNPILLETVTGMVRILTSPLKFAAFYLELGRQLEPSCFDYLYPLPDPHVKELSDLISVILDFGCLEISVASLPLLEDRKHSSALCTFILNHCLKKLTLANTSGHFAEEEARITPDVFRYGLKLADPDAQINSSMKSRRQWQANGPDLKGMNTTTSRTMQKEIETEVLISAVLLSSLVHRLRRD